MTLRHIIPTTLLILLIGISITAPAAADSNAPALPTQFFGTATTTAGPAIPAGTIITIELNGSPAGTYTLAEDGKIGSPGTFGDKVLVSGSGTVKFKIGSVYADQTAEAGSGSAVELTLTFPLTAQTAPVTGSGGGLTTATIISEQPVPAGFALTVRDVTETEKAALPAAPSGTAGVKLIDISPQNAPAGTYQVYLTFTLSAAELNALGVGKEAVRIYHNNAGSWELLRTIDITANPDGSATYRVVTNGFSAYLIAAAGATSTSTPAPGGAGGSGGSGGAGTGTGGTGLVSPATAAATVATTAATQPTPAETLPAASATTAPTAQPTASPAGSLAVLAGLAGAVAVLRRK